MSADIGCLDCHAGLLCIAGVARFYLRTMTEVYVYMQEGSWTSQMVCLDEEEFARCPKVQALFNGEEWADSSSISQRTVSMSGGTRNDVRRWQRQQRRAERGET